MYHITRLQALCHQAKRGNYQFSIRIVVLVCGEENFTEQCDTYGPLFKVKSVERIMTSSNKFIHLPIYLQQQKRRNMKVLLTQLNLGKYFVTENNNRFNFSSSSCYNMPTYLHDRNKRIPTLGKQRKLALNIIDSVTQSKCN